MYTRPIIDALYDIRAGCRKVTIIRGALAFEAAPTLSKDPLFTLRWDVAARARQAKKAQAGPPTNTKRTLRDVHSLRHVERKIRTIYASQKPHTACMLWSPPTYRKTKAIPRHAHAVAPSRPNPHSVAAMSPMEIDWEYDLRHIAVVATDVTMSIKDTDVVMSDSWDDDCHDIDMEDAYYSPAMSPVMQPIQAVAPCTPPRTLPSIMQFPQTPRISRVGLGLIPRTVDPRLRLQSASVSTHSAYPLSVSQEATLVNDDLIVLPVSPTVDSFSPEKNAGLFSGNEVIVKEEYVSPTLEWTSPSLHPEDEEQEAQTTSRDAVDHEDDVEEEYEDNITVISEEQRKAYVKQALEEIFGSDDEDQEELQTAQESLGPVISEPPADEGYARFLSQTNHRIVADQLTDMLQSFAL